MSHHLDTPLASQTGQLYIDDLYVFPGEGSTVLIMDVNSNVNGLCSEPGFHPQARYEVKVHFDGADFETLTYRVSFGEAAPAGGRPSNCTRSPATRRARTPQMASSCWRGGPARRRAEAAPGSGPDASATRSTSTCRCWLLSTGRWQAGPHRTCRHGDRRTRRTASPTPTSTPSSSKSLTSTRSCGPAPAPACGAPPDWPPTRAAGGRSTAPGIP